MNKIKRKGNVINKFQIMCRLVQNKKRNRKGDQ